MENIDKIKDLVDRYFEAGLSLKEESALRKYFSEGKNIPEPLKIYEPVFSYFSSERKKRENRGRRAYFKWIGVAIAASLALFLCFRFSYSDSQRVHSSVYVDGKKYSSEEMIGRKTVETLNDFMDNDNEKEIVSSQIDMLDSFKE